MKRFRNIYRLCHFRRITLSAASLLIIFSGVTHAQVNRYVDSLGSDQGGINQCTDPGNPCKTLSEAFNYASNGDTVWIGVGTYTGIYSIGKSLTILGAGPDQTLIQASPQPNTAENRVFQIVGNVDVSFSDVTIRNGYAKDPDDLGGGIYNPDGTIRLTNVHISDNKAGYGGGIYNEGSAVLDHVTFLRDSSDNEGGGMFNSGANSIQLDQVEFSDNYSNYGGGMANVEICSPVVRNTVFNGNSAEYGGGMCNGDGSNPILTNVNFLGNNAFIGGGMVNFTGSSPQCRNILFQGNAADYGGGMHNQSNCSPVLINVIFSRNMSTAIHSEGGGIYNNAESSPKLVNVTFNGNIASYRGGAIFNVSSSSPSLINTIIWNNQCDSCGSSSQSSIVNLDSLSVPVISYSLIGGSGGSGNAWKSELGIDGSHNIDSDPMFVYAVPVGTAATMADDLHLQANSPGINSGDPATNPSFFVFESQGIPLDLDGNQRVQGGKIDLGPYESDVVNSLSDPQIKQKQMVELRNNFPNPFSNYTTIAYQIPSPGYVLLKVYDTQGKLIAVPVNETVEGGYHELRIYTEGWKPGVYFYSLEVEGYTATRQMILLK